MVLVLLISCGGSDRITLLGGDPPSGDSNQTGDTSGNTDDAGGNNNGGTGTNISTDANPTDAGGSGGPVSAPVIGSVGDTASFLAMGDWGTGGSDQRDVAGAMRSYCNSATCEFVLTLGDNFYSSGVSSTTDPQWEEKFRSIYDPLGLPFYVVLGNHDVDGNVQAEIDYSAINSNWYLPAEYYSFTWPTNSETPLIEFFIFNSQYPAFRDVSVQNWLIQAINNSHATWKILAMHHPIYSDGDHGDDDQGNNADLFPIICGKIDLVLSGHDHDFSYLKKGGTCPIEQLVIGTGGAANRSGVTATEATVIRRGNIHGFGWFQVTASQILFKMIDPTGATFYTTTWTH